MEIREINVMQGPNYWSIKRHKLITMVLDLQEMEERPSHKVEGFYENIKQTLPSLQSHYCSEGHEGGLFERIKDGTWMGHIIEHIALEIQILAGMDVGFGRTRSYGEKGVYTVVFSYEEENAGRFAARSAVDICEALIKGENYNVEADIQAMREIRDSYRLGPSTASIVDEAVKRGIPWIRLNDQSLCQLGHGENQKRVQATVTNDTSCIGVELAGNKHDTKFILEQNEIEIPSGQIIEDQAELKTACENVGFPLVVKPTDGNHGRGITVNINDFETAKGAFKIAKEVSDEVIIEKYIQGNDYRLLVINNKFEAAAKRTPAHVVGDGKLTVQELIDQKNSDPRRGIGHEKILTIITINELTKKIIKDRGYKLDSVLEKGKSLVLKDTANLSTGGTAEDVTDVVHPSLVSMAQRISRVIDLDICGIDLMTTNISQPLSKTNGAVLEVNAGPGFRMHLAPTTGTPRNVAEPVINKLFPKAGDTGEIPIVAVTGTNGKTTTTRLIAHMAKMANYRVGYTTSDGVYIQNELLMKGDCTGPGSTEFVLRDATVNFAVLECARGGMMRSGLGFSHCDVGIVTNVTEDHLGLKGVKSMDELAHAKSVIPETVKKEGYAILNADDERVYSMRKRVSSQVALFSMDPKNPYLKEHQQHGGLAAVYENGYVSLLRGTKKMRVMKAENIPLTYGGKAEFMIKNILPAVLTADIRGFTIQDMKMALETFIPSANQTPGRLNLYQFKNFKVLIDYAHNRDGMRALKKFTDSMETSEKVGIIAGIGDRRDEDNFYIGKIGAEMFDKIIIRLDENLRGRTKEELVKLVTEGIHSVNENMEIKLIPSETEALSYAIENAKENSLVVLACDNVTKVTDHVKKLKAQEGGQKTVIVE